MWMLKFAIGVTNRLLLRKQKGNMNRAESQWHDYDQVESGFIYVYAKNKNKKISF